MNIMSDVKRAMGEIVKKGGSGSSFSALSASECSTAAAAAATLHPFGNIDKDGRVEGSNQANGGSGTGAGKKIQTLRLELNLFEPTADSFPEFNFSKLIHEEQKRRKKSQKKQADRTGNGFLSDPDMDMEVERVAKELEIKYGMGSDYASKSKSAPRPSKLDNYDRGAGYDEEDSFIDNSEAYDELIPQEVETVGGGFYINSGQLEFKQLSNFERPEDAQRMPKPKKRALSTTSESSDDDEPAGEKKKTTQNTAATVQQAQKQSEEKSSASAENQQQNRPPSRDNDKGNMVPESSEPNANASAEDEKSRLNGHVAKKQKIVADNGAVGGGGEQKSKPSSGESGKEKTNGVKGKPSTISNNATNTASNAQGVPSAASVDSGKKEENGGMKELKTTTVKDMLRAKRDSLRKMEQEKKGRSSGSSRVSSSEAEEDGDGGGDEDDDEENGEGDDEDEEEEEDEYDVEEEGGGSDKNSRESVSDVEIVSESESSHESEKDSARGKVTNGTADAAAGQHAPKKRKPKDCQLPADISDQLRNDVESLKEHARALAGNGKLNFFESKVAELLLRIDEGARASTTGSTSTRNAVLRHLEAQLSISRQSLQLKLKKIRIRKLESKTKSVLSKLEDTVSYTMPAIMAKYELDCSKANEMRAAQAANSLPNGEKADGQPSTATPQIRNPKKKYTWNDRARNLLWELYGIRQQVFELARSRNQTEDEVLAEFLRTKVVPLWPKGWIRYEDIHKELDRRKKALAKSQGGGGGGGGGVQSTVGKKTTTTASPLVSPGTTIDTAATTEPGLNGMKGQDVYTAVRSTTPSGVKTVNNSKGVILDVEKVGNNTTTHNPSTGQQSGVSGASISPNSSSKRTSDHSIINIMNSPPPPAAAADSPAVAFANPDVKRSPATPVLHMAPADRKHPQPSPDRQRWNSREDDSDSSIEIIAEYNVPSAAAATVPLPFQSPMLQPAPALPVSGATANLPILNKEKYKNLTVGRNKSHSGGSGSSAGSSPIGMGDVVAPVMGSGKYQKHSTAAGGVIGFAAPSGNVSGPEMGGSVGGVAGSVRQKDTPPSIDVDVHQIMKDLKEYQEFQKQHNVGGNRKADSTALQSQQQHDRSEKKKMAT